MEHDDSELPEDFEDFSHLSDESELDFLAKEMLKPNVRVIKDIAKEDKQAEDTLAIIDDSMSSMKIFDKLAQINQLVDHSIVAELIKLGKSVVHMRMKGHSSLTSAHPSKLQKTWDELKKKNKLKTYVGTGWVFGSERKVIITNNHVLPLKDAAATATLHFDYLTDFRTGKKSTRKLMRLAPEKLFFTSPVQSKGGLDFTVVALEEVADEEYGFLEYEGDHTAKDATRIYVPQHPRGRTKTYVFHNNFKVNQSDDYLTYTSDTEGGSSGSPLFDEKLRLIGLHHVGNYRDNPEGSWARMNTNLGSRIEVVLRDLADQLIDADWTEDQIKEWFGDGSVLKMFND